MVVRSTALLERREIFANPSIPMLISYPYALDVDAPEDLDVAEWYLSQDKVILPHMP